MALALSGCLSAVRDSKLDEYQKQAESLKQELIGVIPDELGAHYDLVSSDIRIGETESGDEKPTDPAWWDVHTNVSLTDQADAGKDAAAAIADHLTADG